MIMNIVMLSYCFSSIGFILYLFWRRAGVKVVSRILFGVALVSHLFFTLNLGFELGHLPVFSPVQAANMIVLLASLVFSFFVFKDTTTVLGAFFLPIACSAQGLIMNSLQADTVFSLSRSRIWYPLHTLTVLGGESLFAVAFIVSVVYLIHDSSIRKGYIHSAASHLPPLKNLDKILSVCLSLGFVAISAGMVFGALWASSLGVTFAHLATKASAGVVTWLVFAFNIHQRFAIGWFGRRTAIITIIGFALMMILFITLNIAFPNAHGIRLTT